MGHAYVVVVSGGAQDLSKVIGHVLLPCHPSEAFGPSQLGVSVRRKVELNHKGK